MLLVHPTSICDVCLDPYDLANPSHAPHAISCGHVFCLSCLQSTHPSLCPLCRKGFIPDRIKKLHIDPFPGPTAGNVTSGGNVGVSAQEAEILHRLAMVSGENAPDEDVVNVMNDAQRWLSDPPPGIALYESPHQHRSIAVYNAVTALHGYRTVRHQTSRLQDSLKQQLDDLRRRLDMKEQDVQHAQVVEDNLVANLREIEDGAKQKLSHLETELTRLRHENEQLRTKYVVTSNPLPHPPQPLVSDFIDSLNRPLTSHSRRSAQSSIPSHINPNNRTSMSRPPYEPVIPNNPTFNVLLPAPEHRSREAESRQERKPRPPVMIPGAHPNKKVVPRPDQNDGVPMLPSDPADFHVGHSDYAGSYFDETSSTHHAGPNGSRRTAQAGSAARVSTYGYPPFSGVVPPPPEDWHSGTSRTHDGGRDDAALGSLRLYSSADSHHPASHHRRSPTIEDAARAIGITGPDSRQNGNFRGQPADAQSLASSVHGQSSIYPPANLSIPPAINSLDLRIAPSPPLAPLAPQTDGQSALGLSRPEYVAPRPEPSPASTWGTVPTPRASNNSSMFNLNLRGLPEATFGSDASANSSFGDLGLTNLPPLGVPSGNSSVSDLGLPSLSLDTLSLDDANPRTGNPVEQTSSVDSSRSNLSSSNSHRRPRESHVMNGHPADSRENYSTRQQSVNGNSSRATSRNSQVSEPEQSSNRSRESSESSSRTSSQLSSRNESLIDLVVRSSRGSRHGSSHEASERGSQGSSESVISDTGMSTSSQSTRGMPGPSVIRPANGQEARQTKDRRRRVSFGPVTHELVEVHHVEHVGDPSQLMTPKGKPMSYSHSKSSRHNHSDSLGEGLGLSLSASTSSDPSCQGITSESDLNLVDQSLMQLVDGESREHRHHRHARHSSAANSLDHQQPVQLIGPRTGYVIYGSGPPSAHGSQGSPSTEPPTLPSTERKAPVPLERRSASDNLPLQDFIMHGNSRDDTIRPRRRPSASTAALSSMGSSAHGHRHNTHDHSLVSAENHHHHLTEDVSDLSRRSSKRHRQTPGPEVVLPSSSEYLPPVGGKSLLLSFTPPPPGPSTSAATTADGEPSSIYAPRPVNSRHSNMFGILNARTDR